MSLNCIALGCQATYIETTMIYIINSHVQVWELIESVKLCAHAHTLPQVFSLGYVEETTTVIVNGIVESIKMAHENMVLGQLYLNSGVLYNASINRSPTAYLLNPLEEREK